MLTREPIELARLVAEADPASGAVTVFEGRVRDNHRGRVVRSLWYESYEALAEKTIAEIVREAQAAFGVRKIAVRHRLGRLGVGDAAVAVVVWSAHRDEGFRACRTVIDEIKKRAPIWKKEEYAEGPGEWVSCAEEEASCRAD